jgi:hypothetical protein
MPKFSVTVPHQLTREQAVERLSHFTERVKKDFGDQVSDLEQSWEGNVLHFRFKTFGFTIKGDLVADAPEVKMNGEIPFAAMMFKGKIEQSIHDELAKLLR